MDTDRDDVMDALDRRVLYLVHRGERASTDVISAALDDLGLNGRMALALEVLLERPGISSAQLGRYCRVSRQAMLGPLRDLEERGLLQRPEPVAGVRVRPLELTPEGRRVAATARDRVRAIERAVLNRLTAADQARLRELLVAYSSAWEALAPVEMSRT